MSFNQVAAETMEGWLKAAGFERSVVGNEVVYLRDHHKDDRLRVIVYTSIPVKEDKVRRKGEDAIRICLVFQQEGEPPVGVGKVPRVFRTGTDKAVHKRLLGRMREMYGFANKVVAAKGCECGSVTYPDSGKCMRWRMHNSKACSATVPQKVKVVSKNQQEFLNEWAKLRAKMVELEKQAEEKGFLSDPDYQADQK